MMRRPTRVVAVASRTEARAKQFIDECQACVPFAPAPRITIDFGDGRQIVRTITGNSIHYVLTSDGQEIAGIPITWQATGGSVTNAGVFTAPASMTGSAPTIS